ncbi:hypothetical protein [Lihuaxuella thermophila]|uniref:Uncharacterized protein n=1 Tax=Lihuaxuella thermophila TaxID=1173111 RepID=A0A1H8I4V7_9BACL|nr:hypothetical protein [Lihuaxuella thermophila]SEN63076.1 hypothetical protein SAMN05444955_1168 [Lihuaxuella thermophila]
MISVSTLPPHIHKAVAPFNPNNDKYDVFPAKVNVGGKSYYAFVFKGNAERLIVEEDGTVPKLTEVIKPALIAPSYNTICGNIGKTGTRWVNTYKTGAFKRLQKALMYMKDKYLAKLDSVTIKSVDSFIHMIDEMNYYQNQLTNVVKSAISFADGTNKKELVTEEDYYTLRNYNVIMVRSAVNQNNIQLEAERDRVQAIQGLSAAIPLFNIKDWLILAYIRHHHKGFLSKTHYPQEAKEMEDLKRMVEVDKPLEQDDEADTILKKYRNPK